MRVCMTRVKKKIRCVASLSIDSRTIWRTEQAECVAPIHSLAVGLFSLFQRGNWWLRHTLTHLSAKWVGTFVCFYVCVCVCERERERAYRGNLAIICILLKHHSKKVKPSFSVYHHSTISAGFRSWSKRSALYIFCIHIIGGVIAFNLDQWFHLCKLMLSTYWDQSANYRVSGGLKPPKTSRIPWMS